MSDYHRNRAAAAWEAFQVAVRAQGGTVLEGAWKGSKTLHRVRCAVGHEGSVRPEHVKRGLGACYECSTGSPAAWAAFRASVQEAGGTVLEVAWKGALVPHRVRCAVGHEANPYPGNVRRGEGICRVCAGNAWDVFYIVQNQDAAMVKFGITSGDARPRLADHAREGFTEVVRLREGLPGTTAPDLERELKMLLRCAGVRPVRGHEYFPDGIRNMLLSTADSWLAARD